MTFGVNTHYTMQFIFRNILISIVHVHTYIFCHLYDMNYICDLICENPPDTHTIHFLLFLHFPVKNDQKIHCAKFHWDTISYEAVAINFMFITFLTNCFKDAFYAFRI